MIMEERHMRDESDKTHCAIALQEMTFQGVDRDLDIV